MKIVSSLLDASLGQPCVVSIGNFDGLHLGHRAILETVIKRARELGLQSAVMTFEPHPIQVLAPDKAPRRISTLDQKVSLIRDAGIDLLYIVGFDASFAKLSPDDFIREYLIGGLHARTICVGSNFNFGHGGRGNVATLKQYGDDFEVIDVPSVTVRGVVASSTAIRNGVAEGRVSRTCRLLGRWIEIEGKIVSGMGRGHLETAPTLNLEPDNELIPRNGVYVSRISLDGSTYMDSVTNVGVRPTYGKGERTIETFVLSHKPPSGRTARLQFLHRLRDEQRFESSDALRLQIGRDVSRTVRFFRLLRATRHVQSH